MQVNGKPFSLKEEQTVLDVLLGLGYEVDAVVVEHNGNIVTREQFAKCLVQNEDTLEVVSFVGGG